VNIFVIEQGGTASSRALVVATVIPVFLAIRKVTDCQGRATRLNISR
jgi:hypothetical protein